MKKLDRQKTCMTLMLLFIVIVIATGCSSSNGKSEQAASKEQSEPKSEDVSKSTNDTFPEKEITYVVPLSPGGGFDTLSRILAPYWGKELGTKIVIENKPGGNYAIGIGEVNNAKPDGYTVGVFNIPGNTVGQILGTANYDLTKFEWIGRITNVNYIAALSKKSKYNSLEDLKNAKEKIPAGIVGMTSTSSVGSMIAADTIGLNLDYVPHKGSKEAILAATRGDVDWVQFPMDTAKPYIVDSKELKPLWVYTKERIPDLPDTPTIGELGYPELANIVSLSYVVGATPGTPPDVVKKLQDTFMKAVNNPDFRKEIEEVAGGGTALNGKETEQLINQALEKNKQYESLFKAQK